MRRVLCLLAVQATLAACQAGASGALELDPTPCTRQVVFDGDDSTLSAQSKQSIDRTYGGQSYCARNLGVGKSFDIVVIRANTLELSRARAQAVRDYLISIGVAAQNIQLSSDRSAKSDVAIEFWSHGLWRMRRNAFDRPG
jgi:hypothetical protein